MKWLLFLLIGSIALSAQPPKVNQDGPNWPTNATVRMVRGKTYYLKALYDWEDQWAKTFPYSPQRPMTNWVAIRAAVLKRQGPNLIVRIQEPPPVRIAVFTNVPTFKKWTSGDTNDWPDRVIWCYAMSLGSNGVLAGFKERVQLFDFGWMPP